MSSLVEYWQDMFKWNYTATRKQYWIPTLIYSLLFNMLFYSTGVAITGFTYVTITNVNPLVGILGVLLFIAQFTITARRLHDSNHSAAWMLIGLVPVIGWIILIIILCQPSKTQLDNEISNQLNQSF